MSYSVQPLLQPLSKVYPDCPGCKTEHLRAPGAPRPFKHLLFVAAIAVIFALPVTSWTPFIYFMVRDFHVADRDEDIGYYAGLIGSISIVGRCLSAVYCGQLSDKYGRRPVILTGLVAVGVCNSLFGASTSLWMALLSQFLLGLASNAVRGPVKAYSSEVCSDEHQALGVAVLGTSFALGLIVGPALGGYLSQPSLKYPGLFPQGSLFDQFPYLLPCLICSAFCMVGAIAAWYMPETIHIHKATEGKHNANDQDVALLGQVADDKDKSGQDQDQSVMSLLRNWPLMTTIIFYSIYSLHNMAYGQIYSLWSVSPVESGGLGLTTTELGNILAATGVGVLLFQMLLFPPMARALGPIKFSRLCAIATLPAILACPWISHLSGTALRASVMLLTVVKSIVGVGALSGSFLLLNNSVHAYQRGGANGLAISVASFFNIIGPALGGVLYAWAQSRDSAFLPENQIVFVVLALQILVSCLWTFPPLMPASLDKPKEIL